MGDTSTLSESLAVTAYTPPAVARPYLGTINDLLRWGTVIPGAREKEVYFAWVPTRGRLLCPELLYFETSRLDLDTDGSTASWGDTRAEKSHQGKTSLDRRAHNQSLAASRAAHEANPSAPMLPVDDAVTDSNVLPYFVLPLRDADTDSEWVGKDHGVMLGDLGVIIGRDQVVFAQFADVGPSGKLGEASIAVHRAFGQEDIAGHARVLNTDLAGPFVTLVFPGSGPPDLRLTPEEIARRGRNLFARLGGMT